MGRGESRPRWQAVVLVGVVTASIVGVSHALRDNPRIQILFFALLGGGMSLTALGAGTRRATFSRLFMGLFAFSVFLSTVPRLDVALIPAVVFWILTVYYGASDVASENAPEVTDDQTE